MVNKAYSYLTEIRNNMKDGEGYTILKDLTCGFKPVNTRVCSEIVLNQGCSIGEHIHEGETEIFYCVSGRGKYIENRIEYDIEKGDTMICTNGSCHAIANESYEPLVFLAIVILE